MRDRLLRFRGVGVVCGGLAALLSAAPFINASAALSPAYVSTLGGPGHAAMYPSGIEVTPSGNIVIADTGNDRVAEYTAAGALVWQTNSPDVPNEGSAAPCGAHGRFPQFQQPRDVGVDSSGNVYVADNGNARIVELNATTGYCMATPFRLPDHGAPIGVTVSSTPSGERVYVANGTRSEVDVFTTSGSLVQSIVASQGTCQLNRVRDAAADSSGNVYVANYEGDDIVEFSSSGECIGAWGSKGTGDGQFRNPYGVAVGTDPYIDDGLPGEAVYVADSNNDRIQEFTPSGAFVAQIGSAGDYSQPGTFTQLRRVAVDASGNVWGADLWGYRVERFLRRSATSYTYDETIPTPVVPPGDSNTSVYNQVRGIGFNGNDVVTMDTVNQRVVVWDSSGDLIGTCGQRGFASTGDFNWPRGVAVDPATGDYWIADTKQSDIQVLTPVAEPQSCEGVAKFGRVGTSLGDDDYPYSIAIGNGYAWIADTKNDRVASWQVSSRSAISDYGTLGTGTGDFNTPAGVAIDPSTGNLWVADSANDRVVELSVSDGTVTSWVMSCSDDFIDPYGVASDGNGHLAVADRNNNRVVILDVDQSGCSQAAVITGADVTGGGPTTLLDPENVAFGPNDDLYIADTYHDRVLVYSLG